ncbi:MAG: B12-binding domain-containing radical SAM protein [Thermoanaerobaculia bacterium]
MTLPLVLLVNPRVVRRRNARLPLSLLTLAAGLEGKARCRIVDGNFDDDATATVLSALAAERPALLGVTVMPGPQVAPAIALSKAVRERHPDVPIVWGGYFPTLYPDAALAAPYVDVVVRGPGEATLAGLLAALGGIGGAPSLANVAGISWKESGRVVHNAERPLGPPDALPPLPYELLGDASRFLQPTYLGRRTAVHQAAIGCRHRCSFCGVVSMFDGKTLLPSAERVARDLLVLKERHGADAVQFYDHNFFDRDETTVPLAEALSRVDLPYWCYARTDALARFPAKTWELVKRSGLRMVFMGAEAASDEALRRMHKGARVEETLEATRRCREAGIVPELSFVLGGPGEDEAEIETTLRFIRKLKGIHPVCEVILYFWTPTPRRRRAGPDEAADPPRGLDLPTTPEEWTEPEWVDFVCHRNAPWLSPRMRRRIDDFATVLGCRFPTVQDVRLPRWGKAVLSAAASWRWAAGAYGGPAELHALRRVLPLRRPEAEGL